MKKRHFYYCVYDKENADVIVETTRNIGEINFKQYDLRFIKEISYMHAVTNKRALRIKI